MTYVMSDIHGDYERYMKMLEVINLDEDRDTLYVLGDVIDFGDAGMKILDDMSSRPNVYPIIGEHEYTALPLLRRLCGDAEESAVAVAALGKEALAAFAAWGKNGGETSAREFFALSPEDREWLVDYLGEFAPYEEVEVGGRDYLLVHAGLDHFSKDRDIEDYGIEELISVSPDYEKVYFADKTLVTGHKPTVEINPGYKGKIFMLNGHIALDCGAAYGLPLGCLRLDDMKEFYVE